VVPAIACASVCENPTLSKIDRKSGPGVNRMPPRRTLISGRSTSASAASSSARSYSVSLGAHQPPAATSEFPGSRLSSIA
jgi:hypothetical protein